MPLGTKQFVILPLLSLSLVQGLLVVSYGSKKTAYGRAAQMPGYPPGRGDIEPWVDDCTLEEAVR